MLGDDIGLDLGTSNVVIYKKGVGIILNEPSVVAVNKISNEVIAVGSDAFKMTGKNPETIFVLTPINDGVISDYDIAEKMLKYFIEKSIGKSIFFKIKPRICACIHNNITDFEKRIIKDTIIKAGARKVYIIDETVATAIGVGLDISRACGSMIVNIGGGITDVAVVSLGNLVVGNSIKIAGNKFDISIIEYIRKKYNFLIGLKTAEEIKKNLGIVYSNTHSVYMDVRGMDLMTGLPKTISVNSEEVNFALKDSVDKIINTIFKVLDATPPELSADIINRGIIMTGGGSLLYGFDKLIEKKTGINVILVEEALNSTAVGAGKYIEILSKKEQGFLLKKR